MGPNKFITLQNQLKQIKSSGLKPYMPLFKKNLFIFTREKFGNRARCLDTSYTPKICFKNVSFSLFYRKELSGRLRKDITSHHNEHILVFNIESEERNIATPVQGTVSCLATHGSSHLLTASDDNSIAVVRMGSFQVL